MGNSKHHTETGNAGVSRRQRMADNHCLRLLYAQKGRVLKGAIKSLDLRVSDIAKEIDVSQGHLSKIFDTYCELDIATCEMYLKKVESALALRGVRMTDSDDQIIVVYERSDWSIDFKIPTD